MTHEDLKVGDRVRYLVNLRDEPVQHVPATVWHKRYGRETSELCSIDLRLEHGLIKEVPLAYIILPSAVERLGELAK